MLTPHKYFICHVLALTLPYKSLIHQVTIENHPFPCYLCHHEVIFSAKPQEDQKQSLTVLKCPKRSALFVHFNKLWPIMKIHHFFIISHPMTNPSYTHLGMTKTFSNDPLCPNRSHPKPTKDLTKVHSKRRMTSNFHNMYILPQLPKSWSNGHETLKITHTHPLASFKIAYTRKFHQNPNKSQLSWHLNKFQTIFIFSDNFSTIHQMTKLPK